MSILSEFREFAARGNVVDLAVGVIMGAAFGKITTSLVDEVVMPVVGLALGKVNFADLLIALDGKTYASLKAAKDAGAPVIAYGSFLNNILNFLITAFVVFALVKAINALRRKKEEEVVEPAAPELSTSEKLLTEIRDSLKKPSVEEAVK